MNRDWPEDEERYNRLDADLSEKDPADAEGSDDTDAARRDRLSAIIDSANPSPRTSVQPDVVYGDTDLDPNRDDERDAHQNSPDDVA